MRLAEDACNFFFFLKTGTHVGSVSTTISAINLPRLPFEWKVSPGNVAVRVFLFFFQRWSATKLIIRSVELQNQDTTCINRKEARLKSEIISCFFFNVLSLFY